MAKSTKLTPKQIDTAVPLTDPSGSLYSKRERRIMKKRVKKSGDTALGSFQLTDAERKDIASAKNGGGDGDEGDSDDDAVGMVVVRKNEAGERKEIKITGKGEDVLGDIVVLKDEEERIDLSDESEGSDSGDSDNDSEEDDNIDEKTTSKTITPPQQQQTKPIPTEKRISKRSLKPFPAGYKCFACSGPHWIVDCPLKITKKKKAPLKALPAFGVGAVRPELGVEPINNGEITLTMPGSKKRPLPTSAASTSDTEEIKEPKKGDKEYIPRGTLLPNKDKVFISGLPFDVKKADVFHFFNTSAQTQSGKSGGGSGGGEVKSVQLLTFEDSGRCNGQCYVQFTSEGVYIDNLIAKLNGKNWPSQDYNKDEGGTEGGEKKAGSRKFHLKVERVKARTFSGAKDSVKKVKTEANKTGSWQGKGGSGEGKVNSGDKYNKDGTEKGWAQKRIDYKEQKEGGGEKKEKKMEKKEKKEKKVKD